MEKIERFIGEIRKMKLSYVVEVFLLDQRNFDDSSRLSTLLVGWLFDERLSFVCTDERVIAAILAEEQNDVISITSLCVEKSYANLGIGKLLIETCLMEIKKLNLKKPVQLMVNVNNKKAFHLYEKFGFKIKNLEKKVYFDSSDGYIMEMQ
jgi:ribosomal protein S18 acetylase RimI-like enzyme